MGKALVINHLQKGPVSYLSSFLSLFSQNFFLAQFPRIDVIYDKDMLFNFIRNCNKSRSLQNCRECYPISD